jgi:autotransporter passenger strand-loop-strand repeat protein
LLCESATSRYSRRKISTDDELSGLDKAPAIVPQNFPADASQDFEITDAQATALGLEDDEGDTTVTFIPGSWSFGYFYNGVTPQTYFIGVAQHELTEAMGRVWKTSAQGGDGDQSILDFYRYTTVNGVIQRDLQPGNASSNNTAYFSLDGGKTNSAGNGVFWNNDATNNTDLADWIGNGPGLNGDSFGAGGPLTTVDMDLMRAIGWQTRFASNEVPTGVVDDVLSGEIHNGFILLPGIDVDVQGYKIPLPGGFQEVGNGGTALNTYISSGGLMQVDGGAKAGFTTVSSGGVAQIQQGATGSAMFSFEGGTINVSGIVSRTDLDGGVVIVNAGGSAITTEINVGDGIGGTQYVQSGGNASGTIVLSGQEIVSSAGMTSGATVHHGGTEYINSGGAAVSSTLRGGDQVVNEGGFASNTQIESGGRETVVGSATNTTVSGGGTQYVLDVFGKTSNTHVLHGGTQEIDLGTADNTTVDSGGRQLVYDFATGAIIHADAVQVVFGTASSTSVSGLEIVSAGGRIADTTVYSGGILRFNGESYPFSNLLLLSGATVEVEAGYNFNAYSINNGVELDVFDEGSASDVNIDFSGTENIWYGGNSNRTNLYFSAVQNIYGGTASGTIVHLGGEAIIFDGGTASSTIVMNSGTVTVSSGGAAIDTTVSSGGVLHVLPGGFADPTVIYDGGMELLDAGALDIGAHVIGGEQDVYGSAVDVLLTGGVDTLGATVAANEFVRSGGVTVNTSVNNLAAEWVYAGGIASGTVVTPGGTLLVETGGSATSAMIGGGSSPGFEFIYAGGIADNTILNNFGYEEINAGGGARNTVINSGGAELIFGGATASAATINRAGVQQVFGGTAFDAVVSSGGDQLVLPGGTAVNTTVSSGGRVDIEAGGSASATRILAGGSQEALAGGTAAGVVFVGPGGMLTLDQPGGLTGSVANWMIGDTIDFASTSIIDPRVSGSILTVTDGGNHSFSYGLTNRQIGTRVTHVDDGHGGTELVLIPVPYVTSIVASPNSGDLNTGAIVNLTLTMSEAVTVTGTPALTLNDGGTATYKSGSGSNTLVFIG